MPLFHDQMHRQIEIPAKPQRIISIVPSQTELLFDLGLDAAIIGITKYCIHPGEKVKQKIKIGGTKELDINLIKSLKPDLIIGNKEENERSPVEELMQHFPVWMSDISDLESALDMVSKVGEITDCATHAQDLITRITQQFNKLTIKPSNHLSIKPSQNRVAYFIWRKPYMVAGKGTFIDDMLKKCGLINVFEAERYPEITSVQLQTVNPDFVLLSSEPYPFKEKHIHEFQALLPNATIKVVDGEMFSWYGSRLLQAPDYFEQLFDNQ